MKIRLMFAFLLIMSAHDAFLQAMDAAVAETEYGGTVVSCGKGRRTIGAQTVKSCPVCTKPLVDTHSLVTRLSCNPDHEVHQACLALIYKTGTCPICQKWMPEFEDARFGESVHKLSAREKALADMEKDANEYAPIVSLALEVNFPIACIVLRKQEEKSQEQVCLLEQQKSRIDELLAQLKERESGLAKRLSDLEQRCVRVCTRFRTNQSDFETARRELSSLERQIATSMR